MNLDSVIIVLREVLEAALLGSLLLALSVRLEFGRQWVVAATISGALGAWWYAHAIGWVSELWDYTGQEMFNAMMQILIFTTFLFLLWALRQPQTKKSHVVSAMTLIVSLALIRELSEILLYLQSYAGQSAQALGVFAGGAMGFMTGASVGVIMYFLTLWAINWGAAQRAILTILAIVVGGILVQVVSLMLQVDRLPALSPVWDTSALISERSVLGQLLYALVGYEATPTLWHVGVYAVSLLLMLSLIHVKREHEQ